MYPYLCACREEALPHPYHKGNKATAMACSERQPGEHSWGPKATHPEMQAPTGL